MLRGAPARGAFAEGLRLAVELESLLAQVSFLQQEGRWWFPNAADLAPAISSEMKRRLAGIERRIERLKPQARRYYLRHVGQAHDFDTWWRGIFGADRALSRKAVELLHGKCRST
jgi:hypothetical protein